VKSAGSALRDRHIEQAERYGRGNYRWVVDEWDRLEPLSPHLREASNTNGCSPSIWQAMTSRAANASLLHRKSVSKGHHDDHWAQRLALSAASIGKALFSEEVLRLIRRDIRKREGLSVDEEDLATAIHAMMSAEAREQLGPMRIRRRRKSARKTGPETIADAPKKGDVEPA
jgi:hypothetical protein